VATRKTVHSKERPGALIVAGPNGTGKSTLAEEFAKQRRHVLISADKIALEFSPSLQPRSMRSTAGRAYYEAIAECVAHKTPLVVETTLAGRGFLKPLRSLQAAGYLTSIAFLLLDSEEACLARVLERVQKGGHDVPEADVRRIFRRSTANFWNVYRHLVDSWHLLYNGGTRFREIALGSRDGVIAVRDDQHFGLLLSIAGADHESVVPPPEESAPFILASSLLWAGNRGARTAQETSRKAGVSNVYVLDGILQYEVTEGKLSPHAPHAN
jgi:predicted ABC-type ATPase